MKRLFCARLLQRPSHNNTTIRQCRRRFSKLKKSPKGGSDLLPLQLLAGVVSASAAYYMVIGEGRQFWDKKYVCDVLCEDAPVGRKVVLTIQVGRNAPPRQMTIGLYVTLVFSSVCFFSRKSLLSLTFCTRRVSTITNTKITGSTKLHRKRVTTSSCYLNPTDRTHLQSFIELFRDLCVKVAIMNFQTAREESQSTAIVLRTRIFEFNIPVRVLYPWPTRVRTRTGRSFSSAPSLNVRYFFFHYHFYHHHQQQTTNNQHSAGLNGRHVVFGRVLDGFDVLSDMENAGSASGKTRGIVRILSCQTSLS